MPGHKVKLAFLFNHEALHQAAHSAPVLGALLRRWANVEIDALFSSQAEREPLLPSCWSARELILIAAAG